jgi:sec-independent protein translocase protein TatA
MLGFLPHVGPWELVAILAVVLIIFGPGKLPDVGKSLGKTIKEFRSASKETADQAEKVLNDPDKGSEK